MNSDIYDYAIIGAGAAGLHLALAMINDPYFRQKKVLVLEKEPKDKNDKTWCFWEETAGQWDNIVTKTWRKGQFFSNKTSQDLYLMPYRYKMIRSIDFYHFAKKKILDAPNFYWVEEEVKNIQPEQPLLLYGNHNNYFANHAFDSRIDPAFYQTDDSYLRLLQHFKGWIIETEKDAFDPNKFVMMDFRLKWKDTTSFTYVLPLSKHKALVEFTLFTSQLIEDKDYSQMLQKYIKTQLSLKEYTIKEEEKGIIPMSNYPFQNHHSALITKIGTAGGWVRPSTGYSFKNAERYAKKVIENIKIGRIPSKGIGTNRFRKYDTLFLDILTNKNELGESIFSSMYRKNDIQKIFKFLDEETSVLEDISILTSFQWAPFLKALKRQLIG